MPNDVIFKFFEDLRVYLEALHQLKAVHQIRRKKESTVMTKEVIRTDTLKKTCPIYTIKTRTIALTFSYCLQ